MGTCSLLLAGEASHGGELYVTPGPELLDCSTLTTTMPPVGRLPCATWGDRVISLRAQASEPRILRIGGDYADFGKTATAETEILTAHYASDGSGVLLSAAWSDTPATNAQLWLPPTDDFGDYKGRAWHQATFLPLANKVLVAGGLYGSEWQCLGSDARFFTQARCAANCQQFYCPSNPLKTYSSSSCNGACPKGDSCVQACVGGEWRCTDPNGFYLSLDECASSCSKSCTPSVGSHIEFARDAVLFDPVTNTWSETTPLAVGGYFPFNDGMATWRDGAVDQALVAGGITADAQRTGPIYSTGICNPICKGTRSNAFFASLHAQLFTGGDVPTWTLIDMVPQTIDVAGTPRVVGQNDLNAIVMADGRILAVGGRRAHQSNIGQAIFPFSNTVQIFDPRTQQWHVAGCTEPGVVCAQPSRMPAVTDCPGEGLCEDGMPDADQDVDSLGGRAAVELVDTADGKVLIGGGAGRAPACTDGSLCALNAAGTDFTCQNGRSTISCQDCPAGDSCVNHVCPLSGLACGPVAGQLFPRRSVLSFDPTSEEFSVAGYMNHPRVFPRWTAISRSPEAFVAHASQEGRDHRSDPGGAAEAFRVIGGLPSLLVGEPRIEILTYHHGVVSATDVGELPGTISYVSNGTRVCIAPTWPEHLQQSTMYDAPDWMVEGGKSAEACNPGTASCVLRGWTGTYLLTATTPRPPSCVPTGP
jgi:hypothetical protein